MTQSRCDPTRRDPAPARPSPAPIGLLNCLPHTIVCSEGGSGLVSLGTRPYAAAQTASPCACSASSSRTSLAVRVGGEAVSVHTHAFPQTRSASHANSTGSPARNARTGRPAGSLTSLIGKIKLELCQVMTVRRQGPRRGSSQDVTQSPLLRMKTTKAWGMGDGRNSPEPASSLRHPWPWQPLSRGPTHQAGDKGHGSC